MVGTDGFQVFPPLFGSTAYFRQPEGLHAPKLTRFLSFSLININFALAKGVDAS